MNAREARCVQILLRYLCGVSVDGNPVKQGQAVEAAKSLAASASRHSFRAVSPGTVWERFGVRESNRPLQ